MMDCAHYRKSMLANPRDADPGLAAHLADCAECGEYTAKLQRFESRLERALCIDAAKREGIDAATGEGSGLSAATATATAAASPARRTPRMHRGWLAMAASVLVVLCVAGSLWIAGAHTSLAAAVVAHMAGEPGAWARTDVAVSEPALADVLRAAHMELRAGAGTVSYAQSCEFRGERVPHLVVQPATGPVTGMVLVHEPVAKAVAFDEEGYRGEIVPVPGHGSLAVLVRGGGADLAAIRRIAARVESATVWTG